MNIKLLFLIFFTQLGSATNVIDTFKNKQGKEIGDLPVFNITIIESNACSKCASARLIRHLEKLSFYSDAKSILLIPDKRKIELQKYLSDEVGLTSDLLEHIIVISDSEMINLFDNEADENHGSIFFLSYKNNKLIYYVNYADLGKEKYTKIKSETPTNKESSVFRDHTIK